MSVVKKGTVFDKDTGRELQYGPDNSVPIQELISLGHIFIENVKSNGPGSWLMWDGLQVVPDTTRNTAYAQAKADRAQQAQDIKDAKARIAAWVYGSGAVVWTDLKPFLNDIKTVLSQ